MIGALVALASMLFLAAMGELKANYKGERIGNFFAAIACVFWVAMFGLGIDMLIRFLAS